MSEENSRNQVKNEIVAVLSRLSQPEQKLFGLVMKLEHENLHLTKPHIKSDLLSAIRKAIK